MSLNAAFIFVVITALGLASHSARAAHFNYLYIEASEGNSSGGHTAIQFGDEIYHYQHLDSGLIRLFRQEADDFHFLYRFLQNRPIHVSRIDVSDETFQRVHDHFNWRYWTQEGLFKLFDDLRKERILIRYLLERTTGDHVSVPAEALSVLQLKGSGLFFPTLDPTRHPQNDGLTRQHSLSIKRLRQKLEHRFGAGILPRLRGNIEKHILPLMPTRWPKPNSTGNELPASVYTFADRYLDSLTAMYAIKALAEERPLQGDAYFQMKQPEFKLTETDRRMLLDLRTHLETGILRSIGSERPDWGYAVLVNMARYLAVDSSLTSGYWVFIDDHDANSEWVAPDDYLQQRGHIEILLSDARTELDRNRRAMNIFPLSESLYSRFEMSANRYVELLKSRTHKDFRFNGERALPVKSIRFAESESLIPDLTREQLTTALVAMDHFEDSLLQQLKQDHRYDLVSRNCVTELFRTLSQALIQSYSSGSEYRDPEQWLISESKERLGGYIAISYNFIPFISYQAVLDQYHVTDHRNLASYRNQELAKLEARQNKLMVALTESNIMSSALYQYNPDDALFVFFTDDHVLLRPVFGVFNTAAGIGQSVYGIFSWPFDAGKNLKSGATGILMSLPELVFFNMRKGSYKYLSFSRLAKGD